MVSVMFDASALAKRYVPEPGTPLLNHIFRVMPADRMSCLMLGAGEVASVLVRKRNKGQLPEPTFVQGMHELRREVIESEAFLTLSISNPVIDTAIGFMVKYAINITDAVLLRSALDAQSGLRILGDGLILVASDDRLLRAANEERLPTFDPATGTADVFDALVSKA